MTRRLELLVPLLAALLASCGGGGGGGAPSHRFTRGGVALEPYAQARALGRGVNFGNLMDAKPDEGSWTDGLVIQESHFDLARQAGFDSVRIPIRFSAHASTTAPYGIDPAFLKRVDQVVAWGLLKGLRVVVDMHHYEEIHLDPQGHRARFVAMWRQLAQHFTSYPGELYYELLTEPNGQLTAAVWSDILAECIAEIRKVDDYHTVIVGAVDWSAVSGLSGLVVPAGETNADVTFHYYNPNLFLMQGQAWAGPDYATTGIVWPGPPSTPLAPAPGVSDWVKHWIEAYDTEPAATNPAGPAVIQQELATAARWGSDHGRPLWMSEFCAQNGGDLASRSRWTAFVRTELEKHAIPWSYWSLLSDPGSVLYDRQAGRWITELTGALGLSVAN